jgi:hypothetical protein
MEGHFGLGGRQGALAWDVARGSPEKYVFWHFSEQNLALRKGQNLILQNGQNLALGVQNLTLQPGQNLALGVQNRALQR